MLIIKRSANMNRLKGIPYGISDFNRLRNDNFYFVDKTIYLPLIERMPSYLSLTLPTVAANVVTDESALIITRARNSARNLFKYPFFFIMSHSFLWIYRFILTESGIIFGCMIDSIWFLNIFYHFSSFSNSFIFRKS